MLNQTFTPTLGAIIQPGQLWPFILIVAIGAFVVYDWWQKRKQKRQ